MVFNKRIIFSIFGLLLIFLFFSLSNFFINILWFNEVGYINTYLVKIFIIGIVFLFSFVLLNLLFFFYNRIFLRKVFLEINFKYEFFNNKKFKILNLACVCISFLLSAEVALSCWNDFLFAFNSVNFNLLDPIFSKDISFYIFKLPLIKNISFRLFLIICFLFVVSFAMKYFLKYFNIGIDFNVLKNLKFKVYLLGSILFLFISLFYVLNSYELVYSKRGVVFGASYVDVSVSLNFYRAISILGIVSCLVLIIYGMGKLKLKFLVFSCCLLFGVAVSEKIVSEVVQNVFVKANEYDYEKKYIDYNIDFTKKAFGIDNINELTVKLSESDDIEDLENYKTLISNFKINSYEPNFQFFKETQALRYYYEFSDLDTDRYNLNGKYTQVFLSSRELDSSNIDNSNWQSKHMYYTHGYGVVMNSVSEVNKEGQPNYLLKDMPQENLTDIPLDNPRIYFGEKTNDYVIVNTDSKEFDYPKEDGNGEYEYTGSGGIKMNLLNRILFSIKERNIRFLTSSSINSDSKILINRNILERVNKIFPFILYDKDPYLVIDEGRLFWVIDGYTITDKFPFSEVFREKNSRVGINYIRNSVKVVVDAYNGTTDFYIVDESDPIAKVLKNIFSNLFKTFDQMPEIVKNHMKYPQTIFNIQSEVLKKYHINDSRVFFSGEDLWDIPITRRGNNGKYILNESTYLTSMFPEKNTPQMVLLEYFNARGKENMVSILGVKMDKDDYGEMFLYKFPAQDVVFGINLFKNKYNQDPHISKEISLWDTKGSEVLYGDTLIFPIGSSLLYLEPLYLRADGKNSVPELKRIIIYYNGKIVIGETLEEVLNVVFNGNVNHNNFENNLENEEGDKVNIKMAKEAFDKAISAQRNGNWAEYGEFIDELGRILENLE